MKSINKIFLFSIFLIISLNGKAQTSDKFEVISIQTSAQCGICKERIEETLAFVKGVKTSDLDLESKIVRVTYHKDKTTPEKIREAISKAGYDADDIKGDSKAYEKLPNCCKKPEDR